VRESVRVGIVGAGWVARNRHLPAFTRDPRARILGIADHSAQRAREVAAKSRIPYYTTDPLELFGRVEVVSICTPPWTHAELSIQALQAGCHVLVEKPMAITPDESRAMAAAAAASQRFLCVCHNFLFSRSAQCALRLLARGAIGQPLSLLGYQLSSWRRRIPQWYGRLPGGLFFDEAPHMLYLIRAFLGDLRVVTARLGGDASGRLSRVQTSLQSERGEAQIEMLAGTPVSEWMLIVVGSEGVVAIDLFRDVALHLRSDGRHVPVDVLATSLRAVTQHLAGVFASGTLFMRRRLSYGHDRLIRQFIDAALGHGPLPVTTADGMAIVRMLNAIITNGRAEGTGIDEELTAAEVRHDGALE